MSYLQDRLAMKNGFKKTAQQERAEARLTPKPIAKVSAKKEGVRVDSVHQAEVEANFLKFKATMTGRCINCGGKTAKDDPKYWKFSAAHILPKKLFKSIAAHPATLVELCFFGNSCHTNYDHSILEAPAMKCWPTLLERFLILYPLIAKEERKHIPEYFLQEIEKR